jgi:integrase
MKSYAGVVVREGKRTGRTFSIRWIGADGKRHFDTLGTEREGWTPKKAHDEKRRREVAAESGAVVPGRQTFGQFAGQWLDSLDPGLKRSTRGGYKTVVNKHLVPSIGTVPLARVTREHIEKMKTKWLKDGLNSTTVNANLQVAHMIFKLALEDGKINAIPPLKRMRRHAPDQPVLSPEQVRAIEKALASLILETPAGTKRGNLTTVLLVFRLIMAAGLRKGEVLGLRWHDLDLGDEPKLRVRETYVRNCVDVPKSDAGRRTIAIGSRLAKVLADHRLWTAYSGDGERVACNPRTGNPFSGHDYADLLREAMERANVNLKIRPQHSLRHSQITLSAASGADAFALMTRSGHSSVQVTQNYIHLAGVLFRDEADAVEQKLYGAVDAK